MGLHPHISNVSPMDLLQTKENLDTLKVKLPDGTVFTMNIFTQGNPEEYLLHVQVVLHLIGQKADVYWASRFEFQKGPRQSRSAD